MDDARGIMDPAGAEAGSEGDVTTGRRETQRARIHLAASLVATTREYDVVLRNVSCTGAMVQGDPLPPVGWTVALTRGAMDELADVVWARGGFCGLYFFDPIPRAAVLELAALPPETKPEKTTLYVSPTQQDDRLSAEEWARTKLRASKMRR